MSILAVGCALRASCLTTSSRLLYASTATLLQAGVPAHTGSNGGRYMSNETAATEVSRSFAAQELPGRKVVFQPDFTLGAQFAGVAVANAEGLYAAHGLEVSVLPPCPGKPGDEVAHVESLQAELNATGLAVGSTEQNVLVAAQASGAAVKGVAAMLQQTPLALGALPGTQLGHLTDLEGKTVGMARDELPLLRAMASVAGLQDISVVEVTHENKIQKLLEGDVDAIQIYSTTETLQLQEAVGVEPNVLPIGKAPYDRGYAQVVFAAASALESEALRGTMASFLSATFEGWQRAAKDPWAAAQAVTLMTGEQPTLEALEFHCDVLKRFLPYLEPEPGSLPGLLSSFEVGTIQPSRWLRAIDTYSRAGLVPHRLATAVAHSADLSLWPPTPLHPAPGAATGSCVAVDGVTVAAQIRQEAAASAEIMLSRHGRRPSLAVVRFGEGSAVEDFRRREVPAKQATSWYCMDKTAEALGIDVHIARLPVDALQSQALAAVAQLNKQPALDGILIELPLPQGMTYDELVAQVSADKRIDALEKHSLGGLLVPQDLEAKHAVPVSPTSCLELLSRAGVSVSGRKVTIVGYGRLVGAPLAQMLMHKGATVSVCSAATPPEALQELCLSADILISAAGVPRLITAEHIARGAVVINIGTVFDPETKLLLPDVCPDVASKASLVAGCPGGVGPIPVAVLMRAVAVNAHRRAAGESSSAPSSGPFLSPSLLPEAAVREHLPPGWEIGWRAGGSAYVCPQEGSSLSALTGGAVRDTLKIGKTFSLPSFDAAVAFINKVAEEAESRQHHPDVQLTDFRHVRLELSSVSAGGVTERDIEMAAVLDELSVQ